MNTGNDSFVNILNEIAQHLKDSISSVATSKAGAMNKCRLSCVKIQRHYSNWEKNMDMIIDKAQNISSLKRLIPYNSELGEAITAFHETINNGREMIGEVKSNLGGKCKKVYKELDVKKHGRSKISENIITSAEIMSKGLREISLIAKENYASTKKAYVEVFLQYNAAVKAMSAKDRKKLSCSKITITPKIIALHIGQLSS